MKPTTSDKTTQDMLAKITLIAFGLALVLVAVRVCISETIRESGTAHIAEFVAPRGLGPSTTLILNLFCTLPMLLVLVRRAIDPQYTLRLHLSQIPMFALAAWIAMTCSWSWTSDKFSAVITASTWCAAMSLGWAMSQLVRSWPRFRIVASLLIGLLLVFITQAAIYRYMEWPEMVRMWNEQQAKAVKPIDEKDQFLASQMDLSVRRGAMLGFFRSPNTFAAIIAISAITAGGFAVQRLKDRDDPGFAIAIALPAIASLGVIFLTGSRTALAGIVLCAIVFAFTFWKRDLLLKHARSAFIAACVACAFTAGIIIAIGKATGGLYQDSLTFRWNYWVGSWSLFKTHPWLGVGWNNFGSSYLAHRLPRAAEEIQDPHNIIVRLMTEAGIVGVVLLITWMIRTAYEATRPVTPQGSAPASSSVKLAVFVAGAYIVLRFIIEPPLPFELYWLDAIKVVLFAAVLAFGMILGSARDSKSMDGDARPAPFLLLGAIIAVGGFWLHAMVDFAMTETGPLMVMTLLIGSILGIRHPGSAGKKPQTPYAIASLGVTCLVLIVFTAMIAIPIISAESHAATAATLADRKQFSAAADEYRQAYESAPVANSDYAMRAAVMMQMAQAKPEAVLGQLQLAIASDPVAMKPWLESARFRIAINDPADAIASDYRQALARDPANVSARLEFAEYLTRAGKIADANEQFRIAIDYDDKLDAKEPRRLSKITRENIAKRLGSGN